MSAATPYLYLRLELLLEQIALGELWLELHAGGSDVRQVDRALDQVRRELNSVEKRLRRLQKAPGAPPESLDAETPV